MPRSKVFTPLNDAEIEAARERRLKEIKMWEILREIISYVLFLWVLYIISFSSLNSNCFLFQKHIKKEFIPKHGFDESVIVITFASVYLFY